VRVCEKGWHMHDNNEMSTRSASLLSCMVEACARSRWDLSGEEMAAARNSGRCTRTTRQACKVLVLWFSCTMVWGWHRGAHVDIGGVGTCTSTKRAPDVLISCLWCTRGRVGVEEGPRRSSWTAGARMCAGGVRACIWPCACTPFILHVR
jgi:hypothetical protein